MPLCGSFSPWLRLAHRDGFSGVCAFAAFCSGTAADVGFARARSCYGCCKSLLPLG